MPPEFTNWRDETQAWQKTCVLFNQSYHMADLAVEGPDALKLLSHLGVNSFAGFAVDQAKQFVPCSHDGYVIGDVILFYLEPNRFNLVGRIPVLNWILPRGHRRLRRQGGTRRRTRAAHHGPRKSYRFQLQGPNAMKVIEKVLGEPPPELKFFNMDGHHRRQVRPHAAARHGRAAGVRDVRPVRGRRGRARGHREGRRGVRTAAGGRPRLLGQHAGIGLDSLAATGRLHRREDEGLSQWLPADGYEGTASIGGSFVSDDIEDYYLTPWDLGYGRYVKFDHDFIGREALEQRAKGTIARRSRSRSTPKT